MQYTRMYMYGWRCGSVGVVDAGDGASAGAGVGVGASAGAGIGAGVAVRS